MQEKDEGRVRPIPDDLKKEILNLGGEREKKNPPTVRGGGTVRRCRVPSLGKNSGAKIPFFGKGKGYVLQ